MVKGYYAYLLMIAGLILRLAGAQSALLQLAAYVLITVGALMLSQVAPSYRWAGVAGIVLVVLKLLDRGAVTLLGDSLRTAQLLLEIAALVPYLLLGCFLLRGIAQQFRAAGESTTAEWLLLIVWSAGVLLSLLLYFGGGVLNETAFSYAAQAAGVLKPVGLIALLADLFRAQKEYIRTGGNTA